jgi:hypothetical protein
MMQIYIYFSFYPKGNGSFRRKRDVFGKDFVFLQLDKK